MVSIIVPIYNAEKYIIETINTVLRQTYTDWELLLIDDCSKDASVKRISELKTKLPESISSRIRIIEKGKNAGAAAARNTGLEQAGGRYIAYLDADDIWYKDKLSKQLEFMQETGAAFSFTAYEFGDEEAISTKKKVSVPPILTYRKALSRTVIFTSTTFFDLEKIDKKFLVMPQVKSEDTAAWWQILRNGYPAYGLNEVTAIYRRPASSLSSNKLKAITRIWYLYRRVEGLGVLYSAYNFVFWAFRATVRRI